MYLLASTLYELSSMHIIIIQILHKFQQVGGACSQWHRFSEAEEYTQSGIQLSLQGQIGFEEQRQVLMIY
jgi:hypothetical protein